MHPALIPEKHPMCGKYMEELLKCRAENPYRKFIGVCSEITWDLSACLKEEKKAVREPRVKKFQERWNARREEDQARMAKLREEQGLAPEDVGERQAAQNLKSGV
ncbi:hypothetical protein HYH03_009865 [Edaphochlamys debaryana]|uniref:COX assembly mitochondrial protein n=1 Tax=Edaphochlamys debaryana TaxID=47281 RepID=A0A835XZK5_9CHLO|nr:hypothetical protein HYH03_009865 [Edaphochlamys debaryana]|eukprot:KAG2491918.1 hypothetical protein HYH03_009865 [Edaphochlamys debaryana]